MYTDVRLVDRKTLEFGLESSHASDRGAVRSEESCNFDPLRIETNEAQGPKFIISPDSEEDEADGRHESTVELQHTITKPSSETDSCNLGHSESKIQVNGLTNLAIDSLDSAHRRQLEQRERFIHDRHNLGLRHLAMKQILNQQQTEKEIMRLKRAETIHALT